MYSLSYRAMVEILNVNPLAVPTLATAIELGLCP